MEDYNPKWGEYCRMICLSILLLGGGMHLDLKGKVYIIILIQIGSCCHFISSICANHGSDFN